MQNGNTDPFQLSGYAGQSGNGVGLRQALFWRQLMSLDVLLWTGEFEAVTTSPAGLHLTTRNISYRLVPRHPPKLVGHGVETGVGAG